MFRWYLKYYEPDWTGTNQYKFRYELNQELIHTSSSIIYLLTSESDQDSDISSNTPNLRWNLFLLELFPKELLLKRTASTLL